MGFFPHMYGRGCTRAQALTVHFNVQKCLNWCGDNSYVFARLMHLKGKKQD